MSAMGATDAALRAALQALRADHRAGHPLDPSAVRDAIAARRPDAPHAEHALLDQLDALLTGPVDQLAARLDHAPGLLDAWDPRGAGARPSNLARNLHHLTSAGAALVLLHHGPARGPLAVAATAIAATAWTLEFTRRRSPAWNALLMRLFGPVAPPDEAHRVNSGTWYATGLAVLACTTPTVPATVALAVLGVGDPVAAQVGRRWGRTRLRDNRTVEGSLACWLAGGTAAWAALAVWHPGVSSWAAAACAAAGTTAGTLAELYADAVDDNLAVPCAAAAAAWIAAAALHLPG